MRKRPINSKKSRDVYNVSTQGINPNNIQKIESFFFVMMNLVGDEMTQLIEKKKD
jgi:hypothetical protein